MGNTWRSRQKQQVNRGVLMEKKKTNAGSTCLYSRSILKTFGKAHLVSYWQIGIISWGYKEKSVTQVFAQHRKKWWSIKGPVKNDHFKSNRFHVVNLQCFVKVLIQFERFYYLVTTKTTTKEKHHSQTHTCHGHKCHISHVFLSSLIIFCLTCSLMCLHLFFAAIFKC